MASAAMAPCGCGIHPYHDGGWPGNAYVRCAQHSFTKKQQAYPTTAEGLKAWEKDYNGLQSYDHDGYPL